MAADAPHQPLTTADTERAAAWRLVERRMMTGLAAAALWAAAVGALLDPSAFGPVVAACLAVLAMAWWRRHQVAGRARARAGVQTGSWAAGWGWPLVGLGLLALAMATAGWPMVQALLPLLWLVQAWGQVAPAQGAAGRAVVMLVALATVLAVGLSAWGGLASGPAGLAAAVTSPVWLWPVSVLLAAAAGRLIGQLTERSHRGARRRELRFRSLQGMAADATWETDARLRLRMLAWRDRRGRLVPQREPVGRRPWDLSVLSMQQDDADQLRADAEGHARLRNLPLTWRCPDGRLRHYRLSGQPRFDQRGRFLGYWGVARDVSDEEAARQALARAEARFALLFRSLPTPLVMHRQGRVLAANPAAAHLLGYGHADAMRGHDLLREHMDAEQRDLARDRLRALDAGVTQEMLPVVPRLLLRTDGEPIYTLATGLRMAVAGRAAVLSIYIDESERQAMRQRAQRQEALLGHLMALGHALVLVSELESGRIVMANDRLLQLLGLQRPQVVGHTERQLGFWPQPADRELLVRVVLNDGQVPDGLVELLRGQRRLVLRASAQRVAGHGVSWWLLSMTPLAAEALPTAEASDDLAEPTVRSDLGPALEPALGGAMGA